MLRSSRMPSNSPTEPPDGKLFVVATPIGHMEDITLRAIRTLKEVDLIAAEDTRQTQKLLTRYNISTPLVSYHDHNKKKRTPELVHKLKAGRSVALVTDAGTPSISDPGYYLIREAVREAISTVPIPGASAAIAALSISGLPTDSFIFIGFVPRKPAKRKELLDELKEQQRTLVFYESPKRVLGLMREILNVMGNRKAVLARELTKVHEEILRGPLSAVLKELSARSFLKGEFTLLVAGREGVPEIDHKSVLDDIKRLRHEQDRSLSDVVKEIARQYNVSRKLVYEQALKLEKNGKSW